MMSIPVSTLRKFSSQADPEVLAGLQDIATREGRQFQAVLGDAMREYLAQKHEQAPRRHVMEPSQRSLKQHEELYRSLAGTGLRIRKPAADSQKPKHVSLPKPIAQTIDVVELLLEERQNHR
jgi:hypothetical protein